MFNCSACLRRAISSLAADLPVSQNPSFSPLAAFPRLQSLYDQLPTHNATPSRSASTLRGLRKGHHRRAYVNALQQKELPRPNTRRNKALDTKVNRRNDEARENNAKHLINPDYQRKLNSKALKEAKFLVDPMRLADEVQRNLKNDNFDRAIALVRASEKQGLNDGKTAGSVNNTVSWNHVCDWCMANHDSKTALKIYNEMKKRGHKPDAHTYTIMLRGFGENIRKPNAVSDAMKVYNSMFEPNSKLKPNTIHTNAIIAVCAKGGKMDDLWSIAGRLPDKGPGGADHATFTTILKAIERDAIGKAARYMAKEAEGSDADFVFEEAVEDGRKLWRDVIVKWRRADLRIDESLVCAMGRLLLLSKRRKDVLDVFRLVEQTMDVKISKGYDDGGVGSEEEGPQQGLTPFQPLPQDQLATITHNAQSNSENSVSSSSVYVQPGNNTLSMLMEAALLTKQPHVGKAYWNVITSPNRQFNVQPDANNVVAFLRLLRFSRASADVVELLQRKWPDDVARDLNKRGVYVIAMSTCVRDKNNPNVFRLAGKIVDVMQGNTSEARQGVTEDREAEDAEEDDYEDDEHDEQRLEERQGMLDLDPKVMTMYLNLAMYTTPGINPRLSLKPPSAVEAQFSQKPAGDDQTFNNNNTIRALRRMGPEAINLKRILRMKMQEMDMQEMNKDRRDSYQRRSGYEAVTVNEKMDDVLGLVRTMIGAYDRILALNFRLEEAAARSRGKAQARGQAHGKAEAGLDRDVVLEARLQKAKLTAYLGKIDKKLVEGKEKGRSGIWEGYDPAKIGEEERPGRHEKETKDMGDEGEADEEEEIKTDYHLQRTTGGARLKKAVKNEQKQLQREDELKQASRKAGSRGAGARRRADVAVGDLTDEYRDMRGGAGTRAEFGREGTAFSADRGGREDCEGRDYDHGRVRNGRDYAGRKVITRDPHTPKRLSRRQKQESEKERREERLRVLRAYDVKSRSNTDRSAASSTAMTGRERRFERRHERRRASADASDGGTEGDATRRSSTSGGTYRSAGATTRSRMEPSRQGGVERMGSRPRNKKPNKPFARSAGSTGSHVQKGWGEGFERAAEAMGMKGREGMVPLRR